MNQKLENEREKSITLRKKKKEENKGRKQSSGSGWILRKNEEHKNAKEKKRKFKMRRFQTENLKANLSMARELLLKEKEKWSENRANYLWNRKMGEVKPQKVFEE